MAKKVLIAYYSRRGENYVNGSIKNLKLGNTEVVAQKIKALLPDADVFQIDTTYEYSKSYMTCIEEAKQELHDQARPEVKNPLESIDEYDTIILGYPNWWGVPPMAVFTFLESYDFSGKKIVPFCSHEGSGLGGSIRQIKMAVPDAELTAGVAIHGAAASHCDREVNLILAQAR
jgi:flavodoxin